MIKWKPSYTSDITVLGVFMGMYGCCNVSYDFAPFLQFSPSVESHAPLVSNFLTTAPLPVHCADKSIGLGSYAAGGARRPWQTPLHISHIAWTLNTGKGSEGILFSKFPTYRLKS